MLAFTQVVAKDLNGKKTIVTKVFNDLVAAYGNAKGKPELVVVPIVDKGNYCIAAYFPTPSPTIKVDEKLIDICMGMGSDSLNALSVIISHELAHYYNDHKWCSDYSFAIRNTPLGRKIKAEAKENSLSNEVQADNFGLYYSCVAGYIPFGVYSTLLERIYTNYQLPERSPGYPGKSERKKIASEAEKQINDLYKQFLQGVTAIEEKNYQTAIDCFENLTRFFPSRENYNNAGTAKTLWALELKPLERMEFTDSNFYYPILADRNSRLNVKLNRSLNEEDTKIMMELLSSAKGDFEKAVSLDHSYEIATVNLACVFDLLGNHEAAIGTIKNFDNKNGHCFGCNRILGISYYHLGDDKKAKEFLDK